MKVLFAGGGTAGHINPALAIAGYLREQQPDAQILYVGAKGGMEERLVPEAGFPFQNITISGFQRRLTMKAMVRNAKTLVRIVTATAESKQILRDFAPDLCIGTGGYVSGPVIREAVRMGIPALIHEQNAYPGVTNKVLSGKVDRVMLAVEDARQYMASDAQCTVTGNPVRQEILRADRERARRALGLDERPLILSFGGSLGARSINEAVVGLLLSSAENQKYQHIHGYGQNGSWLPELLREKGLDLGSAKNIQLKEYIRNMPECMAAADLIICRAGAITLSELQAQGKASILIPSPNVAENHQYHNAMALVRRKAALLLEEKDLSSGALLRMAEQAFSSAGGVQELGKNAKKMAILDASERIYTIMLETLHTT
ncbi:undecaprenyldiphospho-muramoylpentapeptide beta-N-acetylglucosaminyltransferase [Faecalispora anaeroviscerum]|uniref:undecaprenyldiphospho-muramoylpentapeptide beta-N-acetylglucosaminyltransferase n=1 Tax=Faecalispora anaeroviscerum TaxID=2991836 RepID=UPI0024BB8289|nr:undecaprenyldiphospho-muramoylpentapeptide beta-N-acetylglucosaminyltransferase [Faecalispora anaeroviscerum]